ncbi:MAG: nucleotide exchange factor GrpE [Patescibacteria group bacterium]|nr:nucleotide exchange factor GrpE [Patescibacteria group bacterium]MDD5567276.1 nucleotide exchange factor GrpE [Patescibacteria group bacterium]
MSDQKITQTPSEQKTSEADASTKGELEKLKKQAEEYLNGWKRAKADYANLQKETDKRQLEFVQYANEGLLRELLPLVDHFKQAFKHLPEDLKASDWVEGIRHIQTNLEKTLAYFGVKEIPTVGEKFDPAVHEAVEQIQSEEASGTIVEEVKTGFSLHDKLLMPARVKVAK